VRMRMVGLGVLLTVLLGSLMPPASAGGVSGFQRRIRAVGERIAVSEIVSLKLADPRLGRMKDGPFYAYLVDAPLDGYLGDLLPSLINIASDQAEAQLMGRVERLELKLSVAEDRAEGRTPTSDRSPVGAHARA